MKERYFSRVINFNVYFIIHLRIHNSLKDFINYKISYFSDFTYLVDTMTLLSRYYFIT